MGVSSVNITPGVVRQGYSHRFGVYNLSAISAEEVREREYVQNKCQAISTLQRRNQCSFPEPSYQFREDQPKSLSPPMHLRQTNRSERNVAEAVVRPPVGGCPFCIVQFIWCGGSWSIQNGDRKPVFERFDESTSQEHCPKVLSHTMCH